jgi:hypothetical protein
MDRDQAAELKKRLLGIGQALDLALDAMRPLRKDERDALWVHFDELYEIVYRRLLTTIYAEHPELEPPPEPPHIISELRWSEVSLPPSVPVAEIDRIIFSVMKPQWRKMAMIVGQTPVECREIGLPVSDEVVAARIQALADRGSFENHGDLRM